MLSSVVAVDPVAVASFGVSSGASEDPGPTGFADLLAPSEFESDATEPPATREMEDVAPETVSALCAPPVVLPQSQASFLSLLQQSCGAEAVVTDESASVERESMPDVLAALASERLDRSPLAVDDRPAMAVAESPVVVATVTTRLAAVDRAISFELPMNMSAESAGFATEVADRPRAESLLLPVDVSRPVFVQVDTTQRDWQSRLGGQLRWSFEKGLGKIELQLHPQHLGTVDVQLELAGDQARVFLSASNTQARELLETALPQLQSQLQQAGLDLVQAHVSDRNGKGGAPPWTSPPMPFVTTALLPPEADSTGSRLMSRDGRIDDYA